MFFLMFLACSSSSLDVDGAAAFGPVGGAVLTPAVPVETVTFTDGAFVAEPAGSVAPSFQVTSQASSCETWEAGLREMEAASAALFQAEDPCEAMVDYLRAVQGSHVSGARRLYVAFDVEPALAGASTVDLDDTFAKLEYAGLFGDATTPEEIWDVAACDWVAAAEGGPTLAGLTPGERWFLEGTLDLAVGDGVADAAIEAVGVSETSGLEIGVAGAVEAEVCPAPALDPIFVPTPA